ncbi:MAG: glycosyltransferase [Verrucomicrobiota bacterium]
MKPTPLPIGVVLPTLNVRPSLPSHLAQLQTWAELVEEIIVVDSHSTDGTLELIEEKLRHPRLRVLQCPPGLYEAWNYGIQNVGARFTYISTVGEMITGEGLRHLAATAEELRSDVVISRPVFFDAQGRPAEGPRWPIHNLIEWHAVKHPAQVEPWRAFLLGVMDIPEGILGSSASNLYRTELLKRFPFPAEYGHAGDTAWAILHAFDCALAVTPEVFSRFVLHPSAARSKSSGKRALTDRLFDLARQAAREIPDGPANAPLKGLLHLLLTQLPAEIAELRECKYLYDHARRKAWPWVLNPAAWKVRRQRDRRQRRVRETKRKIRRQLAAPPAAGRGRARNTS